jgi:hypothetical protein
VARLAPRFSAVVLFPVPPLKLKIATVNITSFYCLNVFRYYALRVLKYKGLIGLDNWVT